MKFIGLSWKERNIQMQFNAEYRTEMDKLMLSIVEHEHSHVGSKREKPKDAVVNKEQEEWHLERLEITYFIWLEALALHPMFPEGQHAVLKAHCKGGAQITPHSLDPCFPNASGEPSSKCVNKHCQPKPCELLEMTHHLNYYSYFKTDDGKMGVFHSGTERAQSCQLWVIEFCDLQFVTAEILVWQLQFKL